MLYLLLMLPAIGLVLFAQWKVKSTFNKYSKEPLHQRKTGAQVAAEILRANGLFEVPVEHVPGQLSDHYDPRSRTLRLSDSVYGQSSVAAAGVAAHEVGHALQHAQGYVPLQVRSAIVPVASIGSQLGPILLIGGVIFQVLQLAWLGLAFFAAATIFAAVTLPVEFNASSRAMAQLTNLGIVDRTEYGQSRKVLNAAALTYVAGFAVAVLQLLYWIMVVTGMRRGD